MNRAYTNKYEIPGASLPQSFAVARKDEANLTYKKGGSRRRALTSREAADAEEEATRHRIRAVELEEERQKRYTEQLNIDQQPISDFLQQIWPRERGDAPLARSPTNDFIPPDDGDSDIKYLGTQPAQKPS